MHLETALVCRWERSLVVAICSVEMLLHASTLSPFEDKKC